jgi:hypothetical protein
MGAVTLQLLYPHASQQGCSATNSLGMPPSVVLANNCSDPKQEMQLGPEKN